MDINSCEEKELYVCDSKGHATKQVEMVGMDKIIAKQKHLEKLKTVTLNHAAISKADKEIQSFTPSTDRIAFELIDLDIVDLEMAGNLFDSWDTVIDIVKQLPHLEVLNLSDNSLRLPNKDSPDLKVAFPNPHRMLVSAGRDGVVKVWK